ncbi:hypothetical protein HKD37_15G043442 [Glycine soja]
MGKLNRRHLRDIVSQYPSIFLVYATHGLFAKVEDFWENLGFKPIFIQESSGQSGGIWVLSSVLHIFMHLYVPRCATFFDSTSDIRGVLLHYQTCFCGQLNEILCPSKVSGGKFNSSRACLFANMMATYGLMDLDRFGGFFTWRKNIQSGGHLRRKKT